MTTSPTGEEEPVAGERERKTCHRQRGPTRDRGEEVSAASRVSHVESVRHVAAPQDAASTGGTDESPLWLRARMISAYGYGKAFGITEPWS